MAASTNAPIRRKKGTKEMTRKVLATLASMAAIIAAVTIVTAGTAKADDPACVQHGSLHAYICAYHEPGTGGGVYLADVLFENWYYWHPSTGDLVVDETYTKSSAPGFNGDHRSIHFADTVSITDLAWLRNFPHNTSPPLTCGDSGCSTLQQKSAMDFQHAMITDNPPHSY